MRSKGSPQETPRLPRLTTRLKARLGFLTLVSTVLSACASHGTYRPLAEQPPVYPPAVYAHRVSSPDVDIYWNCTQPEPGLIRLDGVAQNTGGREVRFLELQLQSVDAKDHSMLEAAAAVPDILLYTNQASPFRLELRTMGNEVRYDLFYRYSMGIRLSKQGIHFMARDVCSETQHRVSSKRG